jgi:hypothetical protein
MVTENAAAASNLSTVLLPATGSGETHRTLSAPGAQLSFPRSTDTRPEVTTGHQEGCPDACATPPEFRQRAVELARQGTTPVSKIAKLIFARTGVWVRGLAEFAGWASVLIR